MSNLTKKQRDVQERKSLILDTARARLAQDGYHKLRLEDLAKDVGCAKGTIVNDFESKEEIILALAIQSTQQRVGLFRRAAVHSALPRERIIGVSYACEVFHRLHPEHFAFEHLIRSTSFWENTSNQRQLEFRGHEAQCVSTVAGIVTDAVSRGDLQLPDEIAPTEIVYGLWAMTYGAYSILATAQDALSTMGITDPFEALRRNQSLLLDGYGWKPLSYEHDYQQSLEKIQREVFPEEYRRAAGR